jgi:hypothetical protein
MASIYHFDVIFIGGTQATLISALSARESGARVAIIESSSRADRGGNCHYACKSSGIHQDGIPSIEPFLHAGLKKYVTHHNPGLLTKENYEQDLLRPLLRKSFSETMIEGTCGEVNTPAAMREGVGLGGDVWEVVDETEISVFYSTLAENLIRKGNTVLGVRIWQRDCKMELMGQVILGCGEFEALQRKHLDVSETPFNTGTMTEKHRSLACGVTHDITFPYDGLRTDSVARDLNNEGLHMPGLWAVGEVSASSNYLDTGLGRIAGKAAARRAEETAGIRKIVNDGKANCVAERKRRGRDVPVDRNDLGFVKRQELFIAGLEIMLSSMQL